MSKKHFIAPIVLQWIEKLDDKNSTVFVKESYAGYLEETKKAIEAGLARYNMGKKS